MSVTKVERLENSVVKIEVSVEREQFELAIDAAYRKNVARMNVPGFRRGKAPRKMIEKMYGTGVFYEDAVDYAYPVAYQQAIESENLVPVEQPEVNITSITEDGFTFTAQFTVRPEITLAQYKGIHAVHSKAVVTDEDIDAELEQLRNRNARMEDSKTPLANGDTAIIDFEGFVDDVAFEGGAGTNYKLGIGSGQFIPGFEEQLIGKSAGESTDVNVTFPEQYHAEDLAGKEAVFKVTIHETKTTIKPTLDDEFAGDVSEFDTLEELKNSIRDRLMHQREHQVDDMFEAAIIDKMLEGFEGVVPDIMVEDQLSSIMQDFSYRLSMQGMELAQYLQFTGMTIEDLQNQHRETAKRHVMCDLAFHKIAQEEGLTVSDEEVIDEYNKLAERYKMPVTQVKSSIPERSLRRDMLALKGSEFLRASAIADEPAV